MCIRDSHKYDPITQKEYYQFYSFFNQSQDADRGDDSPRLPYPSKEQTEKLEVISKEIKSLESMLNVHTPELANGQQNWELKSLRDLAKPKPKKSVWESIGPFKSDSFDLPNAKEIPFFSTSFLAVLIPAVSDRTTG